MSEFKVATFNVNSVRTRLPIILEWLSKHKPDALCLQETKVQDSEFPLEDFTNAGYNIVFHGQKAYNGVAIVTPHKPLSVKYGLRDIDEPEQARLIQAKINGINIINTYVPQGREMGTEYFEYKLNWLKRLKKFFQRDFTPRHKIIWCGDINIAPEDIDLFNPKGSKGHVCFNPECTSMLYDVMSWGFVDVFRMHHPDEPGQYSWFDYRTRNSVENNRGWRVDMIFATKSLVKKSTDSFIDLEPRRKEKPSDHAPVVALFDL